MSYAVSTTLIPDNTSDSTFRLWGSSVSATISSMGLVQTSDTGQINWATVAHPTATLVSQGYEIWKFNDSLQGTVPIFLKFEYGSAGGAAARPGLFLTIGSGSNGSGNLTGQTTSRFPMYGTTTDTNSRTCVFSGDTNRVGMSLFSSLSGGSISWFLERTKNSDGTDSSLGALLMMLDSANVRRMQFIPASGTVPAVNSDTNILPPVSSTGGSYGNDLAIYTNPMTRGGGFLNAGMTHLGYFNTDIISDTTFVVTLYNAVHTFYALGNIPSFVGRGGFTGITLAMRFE